MAKVLVSVFTVLVGLFHRVSVWLEGKKTYLLAGATILAALLLLAFGQMTPAVALTVIIVAAAGFGATFRSALQANHDQALQVAIDTAALIKALATHNTGAAQLIGTRLVGEGYTLAEEIEVAEAMPASAVAPAAGKAGAA